MQSSQEKLSTKKIRAGKKRLKDYGKVLLAKQLLRALYNNPRERTFKKYFLSLGNANRASIKKRGSMSPQSYTNKSASTVFENLNSRLDIVLTAMGGALSSKHAQQLINHGKITVNGHIIKERGYLLQNGDIIASTDNFNLNRVFDKTYLDSQKGVVSPPEGGVEQTAPAGVAAHQRGEITNSIFENTNQVKDSPLGSLISGKQNLRSQIACLKPKKIPSRLHLKTPVFAHLLINTKLNYGIYYSKPNLFFLEAETTCTPSFNYQDGTPQRGTDVVIETIPGEGWKNTNVKVIKSLLFDLNLALQELNALNVSYKQPTPEGWVEEDNSNIVTVVSSLKKNIVGNRINQLTVPELRTKYIKRIKSIYSILYSLVQAYYSRQH